MQLQMHKAINAAISLLGIYMLAHMLNDVSLFKWLFIVAVTIIIKGERIPQYPSRELAININQGTSINGITGPRKRMKTVYTGVCVSHSVMSNSLWPQGL